MNRFIRFYNQNRKSIIIGIIAIVFIIAIIQVLNNVSMQQLNLQANQIKNQVNVTNENNYVEQNNALLSSDKRTSKDKQESAETVDSFLSHCINNEIEEAYSMISADCKKIFYPSLDAFRVKYFEDMFGENKKYSFQLWSGADANVYLIKIHDNMLATGQIASVKNYKEDYYSVVKEDDTYKLNINNFIGIVHRNKEEEKKEIKIEITDSEVYMDYEIYNIIVTNNSNNNIILDTRENTNTTYITTNSGANMEAMLYENYEEDLKVESGESKNIKIKFSNSYQEDIKASSLTFSEVILNEDKYESNKEDYENYEEFVIDW